MRFLKEGFRLASRQLFAISTMFLFHLSWGWLFYRFVERHVIEVMGRFPPPEFGGERIDLFLYESMILLQHSDIAIPVLWMLLIYIAVRLLLTPALQAGIYLSLHDQTGPRGTVFLTGFRQFGGSFTWLYLLRLAFTVIPLYWIWPAVLTNIRLADSYLDAAFSIAPWVISLAVYGGLLKVLFTYVLFALTADERLWPSLVLAFRRLPAVCGLALAVFGIAVILGLIIQSISFYYAGFLTVVLYLGYPLVQIWLRTWSIAVQYRYWCASKS